MSKKQKNTKGKAGGDKGPKKKRPSPDKVEREEKEDISFFSRLPSWWPLPVLILAGIFFRLATTLWQPIIYPDSLQYMHLAKEIRSGEFFTKDYELTEGFIKSRRLPPLYSFMISPFAQTQADLEEVGIIISLVLSTLTFVPLYFIGLLLFNRRAALIGCSILVFQPFILRYAHPILSEATFTFLFVSAMAAATWGLKRPSVTVFVLAGVLSSLSYMTRDVGITAGPLVVAGIIVKLGFVDRMPWKRVAILAVATAIAAGAVAFPYLLHIRARTGGWGLTVQMDNTSITKQIQLYGGDRYDRDRLRGEDTGLIGKESARGVFDLIKLIPGLAKKLVVNLGQYGEAIWNKWVQFNLALLLAGIFSIVVNFSGRREKEQLFNGAWAFVWPAQIWALYALITPYMVDQRYMYPAMAAGLVLAGVGADRILRNTADYAANYEGQENFPAHELILYPAVAIIYLSLIPAGMDRDVMNTAEFMYPDSPMLVFAWPVTGSVIFFVAALMPASRLISERFFNDSQKSHLAVAAAIASLLIGMVMAVMIGTDPPLIKQIPSMLLIGLGGSLLLVTAGKNGAISGRHVIQGGAVLIIVFSFISQYPSLEDIFQRTATLENKYATGHKQVASKIKSLGLVPPGKTIVSRKPFMAYYLDGNWRLDEQKKESMPKTLNEVEELIASGDVDYLVADSFTFKSLRPRLMPIVYNMVPIKGAHVIFSYYFEEYNRMVTVYDCHGNGPGIAGLTAEKHLEEAGRYFQNKDLVTAYKHVERAIRLDPDNRQAWYLSRIILELFYDTSARSDMPSMVLDPFLLPALRKSAKEYMRLSPGVREAEERYELIDRVYQRELEKISAFRRKYRKQ